MKNRVENLGDYNTMRIMLQEYGGDLSALVKDIKRFDLPKHVSIGILIGTTIGVVGTILTSKISSHFKGRKAIREKELEEKLRETLIDEGLLEEDTADSPVKQEEPPC